MGIFHWEDIDHRLINLKLLDLAQDMNALIKADERRIQFDNRGNMNTNTVPSLVLEMKQNRADEFARKTYEIYCEVWKTQGHGKSAVFVRAVSSHAIVPLLRARARAIASEFSMFGLRTSFPGTIQAAHLQSLKLNMQRLEDRWRRRLEIEAEECAHTERAVTNTLLTHPNPVSATSNPSAESLNLAIERHSGQSHPTAPHSTKGARPGPLSKRSRSFVSYAGSLWREAISDTGMVSIDKLREIATVLDTATYAPPSTYLEGKYARELKDFNRRNSNSKIGPVLTWSQLVSHGDKDHLQGMRRLLSRCAKEKHDPSGIRN
jgi:hypothetical protein